MNTCPGCGDPIRDDERVCHNCINTNDDPEFGNGVTTDV